MCMEEIGILLRKYREQKGLSQENVADYLGTTSSNVSKIETGKVKAKFETIVKFCDAMNVRLGELLVSEENRGKNECHINFNINISSPESLRECLKVIDEHNLHVKK